MWVSKPVQASLQPLTWLGDDGVALPGFRLPLLVGQPASVDPHSPHAIPTPLPQDMQAPHVLLVGYSVPWIQQATPAQLCDLQTAGFRLSASRGGAQPGVDSVTLRGAPTVGRPGGAQPITKQVEGQQRSGSGADLAPSQEMSAKVFSTFLELDGEPSQDCDHVGLLDACALAESIEGQGGETGRGTWSEHDFNESQVSLEEDVQPDTFAEGSVSSRGAYARRLEARVFEPADWGQVKRYLEGLGLPHLIPAIDEMGVDSLEDFGFLYREDLMEAGASKEEAEAILGCTRAESDGRPDGPAQARAGFHRPSRPIAPARPAAAARMVQAPDRAGRIQEGAQGSGTARGIQGQEGTQGSGTARGIPGQEGAQVSAQHKAFQVRKAIKTSAPYKAFQDRRVYRA